jgi:hypothetical protein
MSLWGTFSIQTVGPSIFPSNTTLCDASCVLPALTMLYFFCCGLPLPSVVMFYLCFGFCSFTFHSLLPLYCFSWPPESLFVCLFVFAVLEVKLRISCLLGSYSTTELRPYSLLWAVYVCVRAVLFSERMSAGLCTALPVGVSPVCCLWGDCPSPGTLHTLDLIAPVREHCGPL